MGNTLDADIRKKDGFYCYGVGGDAVAYTMPQLWSTQMPIGLVSVMPHEDGADRLLAGLDTLQKWVYTLPLQVSQDLRANDRERNLKASRFLNEEYRMRFGGRALFMLYFVGGKKEGEVYEIPSSVVLASGHNPKLFTHDVLLYLLGEPAVAVSRERGKEKHAEITAAQALYELNRLLRGRYEKPLSAISISVGGNESGLVIPVNGIKQHENPHKLEAIAQASH